LRDHAAESLLLAKNCRTGYRDLFLSISACWHLLARQDEAVSALLASWTDLQIPELEMMAEGRHAKKTAPSEYSFRPELIAAMRTAFLKACEAPQVRDAGHGAMEIPRRSGEAALGRRGSCC
jgi:hypothetical protein